MEKSETIKITGHIRPSSSIVRFWSFSRLSSPKIMGRIIFFAMILSVVAIAAICVINAVQWLDKPFPGFLLNERMAVGGFGQYHWTGVQAGLQALDKILAANDTAVLSTQELEEIVYNTPVGSTIKYAVERNGQVFEALIPTMRFSRVDLFMTFGITLLSGLIYLSLGMIVFILKPHTVESWAFLLACFFLSLYTITSFDTQSTHWGFIRAFIFAMVFFPAALVHLSLVFPERKKSVERYPFLAVFPYICSLALFVPFEFLYPEPTFLPIYKLTLAYVVISALIIAISTLQAYFRTSSMVTKQRARVILLGAGLAFPLPLFAHYMAVFESSVMRLTIQQNFLAVPVLIFPAAVAYAIVKHNLFDIDTVVRRTYGYMLSTAAIVGIYVLIVSVLNLSFRSLDLSRSPLFPLAFALIVLFFFAPLHRRLQSIVDRAFYRQHYDYRKTIKDISEVMITMLDRELIYKTLVSSVVKEMLLENGLLLLLDQPGRTYRVQIAEGVDTGSLVSRQIDGNDILLHVLREKNDAILHHEIDLHPRYEPHRETLQNTFRSFASELMLPLKYEDEMRGVISLGRKKSGQMFTLEDLDLLKTMTNQSALALENARLFKESLEKGRLEEELKIARDIQVSMLPEKAPDIAGLTIAARSIPAREVGGDFYDFIALGDGGMDDRLGIVIGDVSGKAISGALLMAASKSIFRVLAETLPSIEAVMRMGNQRLQRDMKKGMFVALLYAVVDPWQKILTVANAGLAQPILYSRDRARSFYIQTEGDRFPLGIIKDCSYRATRVPLEQGDTVVFYTDGVVEAMNNKRELYGFDRLIAAIEAGRDLDATGLLNKLQNDVARYVGDAEQHDDLTIVVMRVGTF